MARENRVSLWGRLLMDPIISVGNITKEPLKASFFLAVVNQNRDDVFNGEDIIYAEPFVYTQDAELVKEIATWKKGDMVDVRGVITTLDAKRGAQCIHCGHQMLRDGEVTLITPTFVEKRFSDLSDKEAEEILKKHREVSNTVNLTGFLCDDVRTEKKAKIYGDIVSRVAYKGLTKYQIAVNRHLFIKSDDPATKTDFPHIISVGEQAEKDALCLHKGSLVSIEGMIVTRNFRRTHTCPACGQKFDREEKVTEVIAYGVEYLRDFYEITGSAAEEKARRKDMALKDAMSALGYKADDEDEE